MCPRFWVSWMFAIPKTRNTHSVNKRSYPTNWSRTTCFQQMTEKRKHVEHNLGFVTEYPSYLVREKVKENVSVFSLSRSCKFQSLQLLSSGSFFNACRSINWLFAPFDLKLVASLDQFCFSIFQIGRVIDPFEHCSATRIGLLELSLENSSYICCRLCFSRTGLTLNLFLNR